jgi:3-phenylpropionate/trans-cinnamate dioxygenase ferredoxin reductase subunit
MDAGLLIIGASYAGMQLAASVRAKGYAGRVVMVGEEIHAPYQRPPLSKGLLLGKNTPESLMIRSPAYFEENCIQLRLGQRATRINTSKKSVQLSDGSTMGYEWLALTTGARCRVLALKGADLQGVHSLRSLDDALAIDALAETVRHVCVVGAGFIGLEVASALVTRGLQVTVLETEQQVLGRAVSPELAGYLSALHQARGVTVRCGLSVQALLGNAQGRVNAVRLTNGEKIDCEAVVVGIGVIANDELAVDAGIDCENGILVDRLGCTSVPGVLAAGDCASFANPYAPDPMQSMRLESIQVANDLARAAASVVVGLHQPYDAVPWFWSDQYDTKLQIAGLSAPGDQRVLRGSLIEGRFSIFYLRGGHIVCAHSVNRPAEHLLARKLIASWCVATAAEISDVQFELKSLLERSKELASTAPKGALDLKPSIDV